MHHVLGMAKSNLDLSGAKGPKLELDLLRLAYAAKALSERGATCSCYLCVMNEPVAKRVAAWKRRYDAEKLVEVIVVPSGAVDAFRLLAEKRSNVQGMLNGTQGIAVEGKSEARYGRDAGEDYLHETIRKRHPGVRTVSDKVLLPLSVQWDFYGQTGDDGRTR